MRAISGPSTLEAKFSTPSKMLSTTDWKRPGTMARFRAPSTKNRIMTMLVSQADSRVLVMATWVRPMGLKWCSSSPSPWSADPDAGGCSASAAGFSSASLG